MRKTPADTAAAAAATALPTASLVAVAAAPAAASSVRVPPASVHGVCGADAVPVVAASDVAAQSDIYSAATLAGALGDAFIVLAGSRGEAQPADQKTRLDAAASGSHVAGRLAAVPDSKDVGRAIARLCGALDVGLLARQRPRRLGMRQLSSQSAKAPDRPERNDRMKSESRSQGRTHGRC